MSNVISFFNEIKSELKKVTWPSKNELVGSVIIVCLLTLVFAIILGGMDFIFSYLIKQFVI